MPWGWWGVAHTFLAQHLRPRQASVAPGEQDLHPAASGMVWTPRLCPQLGLDLRKSQGVQA